MKKFENEMHEKYFKMFGWIFPLDVKASYSKHRL